MTLKPTTSRFVYNYSDLRLISFPTFSMLFQPLCEPNNPDLPCPDPADTDEEVEEYALVKSYREFGQLSRKSFLFFFQSDEDWLDTFLTAWDKMVEHGNVGNLTPVP